MQYGRISSVLGVFLLFLLVTTAATTVFGQGRGRGQGQNQGQGQGNGQGNGGGLTNASGRSGGRVDDGLATADTRSGGRSTAGFSRAEAAKVNASSVSGSELNRYRGLSKRFGLTTEEMRDRYEAALVVAPDMTFGQFVAANVVADNLNSKYPNVTADALIAAMGSGRSLGDALKGLRVSDTDVNSAAGVVRARMTAAKTEDKELNRYRGISKRLGTSADVLRSRYEAALIDNPKLSFGNFVSAHVVADNLNSRYPSVTAEAILLAMADGDSLGSALRSLGVPDDDADTAKDNATAKIKAAKKN